MKIVSVADIKARLSAYLNESRQGPVVVTRNGKAVAVLIAVTDDDELERLVLAHSPKFQALLDKSRRQIEETGGIPHEQFWRELEAERRKADAVTSAATAEQVYGLESQEGAPRTGLNNSSFS
jgi:prevent-host-death family protein